MEMEIVAKQSVKAQQWDSGDLELLRQSKKNELMQKTGVRMPTQAAVSKDKMAWNCRRKTRGITVTTSKEEVLILQPRDGCLWSSQPEIFESYKSKSNN
ncbi:unnamed protein product [Clavelina lepadiformis]|uniref:Uncharacterized protein n=1 Tax=Clavelina lepadiformis TaxID=159417 RepID=A0ABP0G6Z9_CLALP